MNFLEKKVINLKLVVESHQQSIKSPFIRRIFCSAKMIVLPLRNVYKPIY